MTLRSCRLPFSIWARISSTDARQHAQARVVAEEAQPALDERHRKIGPRPGQEIVAGCGVPLLLKQIGRVARRPRPAGRCARIHDWQRSDDGLGEIQLKRDASDCVHLSAHGEIGVEHGRRLQPRTSLRIERRLRSAARDGLPWPGLANHRGDDPPQLSFGHRQDGSRCRVEVAALVRDDGVAVGLEQRIGGLAVSGRGHQQEAKCGEPGASHRAYLSGWALWRTAPRLFPTTIGSSHDASFTPSCRCRRARGRGSRGVSRSAARFLRSDHQERPRPRRHRQPVVSRRPRGARRHHRAHRLPDRRAGRAHDRRPRPDRGAGLHRHPLARAGRHLRGADGRELHPPGRDHGDRRSGRILADPAETVSGEGGGHTRDRELRDVHRTGVGARRSDRRR